MATWRSMTECGCVVLHAVKGPVSQSVDGYLEKSDSVWLCHIACSTEARQSLVEGCLEKHDRVWLCHVTCSREAKQSMFVYMYVFNLVCFHAVYFAVLATTNHSLGFLTAFQMIEDVLMDGSTLSGESSFTLILILHVQHVFGALFQWARGHVYKDAFPMSNQLQSWQYPFEDCTSFSKRQNWLIFCVSVSLCVCGGGEGLEGGGIKKRSFLLVVFCSLFLDAVCQRQSWK